MIKLIKEYFEDKKQNFRKRPQSGWTIKDYAEMRKDAISKGYTGTESIYDVMNDYDLDHVEASALLSRIRDTKNESCRRLREQDVEIEVKHKVAIDEDYVDGKYYDSHTLSRHWYENLTDYGRKQLFSTYTPLDFDAWVGSMLDKGYTKLDIMSFLGCVEEMSIRNIKNWMSHWLDEGVEIEVKHKGILEVPEGKNVDDLPISHFEKLAKKKGLSNITKALNNLQVWNKNDDPKLSKWAGDMIDKLNKKFEKNESYFDRNFGWKERTITVDDDEQEAAVEEILADAKNYDDRIEWDIDYNGGMFGGNRVFYIYSDEDTYYDVKLKVNEMKDDAIYGRGVYESIIKESEQESYWKYNLMDTDDDKYYNDRTVRRIKLIPCDNPDDCYVDENGSTFWAVCDYEYPYEEVYCTKDEAYEYLLTRLNNSRYEREHDI